MAASVADLDAAAQVAERAGSESESDAGEDAHIRMSETVVEDIVAVLRQTALQADTVVRCHATWTRNARLAKSLIAYHLKRQMKDIQLKSVKFGSHSMPPLALKPFQADGTVPAATEQRELKIRAGCAATRVAHGTGVRWLASRYLAGSPAILADDMGLGKTVQVLAFLAWLRTFGDCAWAPLPVRHACAAFLTNGRGGSGGPHLIVAPSSLLENWCRELRRWVPSAPQLVLDGSAASRRQLLASWRQTALAPGSVVLVSYRTVEAASKFASGSERCEWDEVLQLAGGRFGVMVLDEAHELRNSNTAKFKALHRTPTGMRLLVTGTPIQNNLRELVNILAFLSCDVLVRAVSEFSSAVRKQGVARQRSIASEGVAPGDTLAWEEALADGMLSDVLHGLAVSLQAWVDKPCSGAPRAKADSGATRIAELLHHLVLRRSKAVVLRDLVRIAARRRRN